MADSGRVPHALLFSGISGIGKYRVALAFSQYLHCQNHIDGDSCGKCPSCMQHQKFNNPDLNFIFPIVKKEGATVSSDFITEWRNMLSAHPYMPTEIWNDIINAGNSQPSIYVNESETILSKAALSTYQESFKIFLIWLPEKLRPEAANKLLKVIEEPFEDIIFILVSNDDSKILPTIFSRTQRFNFRPLCEKEVSDYLSYNLGIERHIAENAARIAGGSMAKAEEIAVHPEELNEFSDYFKESMRMAYALKAKRLKEISEETSNMGREKLIRFLTYCGRMVRENFFYNMRNPNLIGMTDDEEQFSRRFATFIHEDNVEELSEEISRAVTDIERNANSKIVMFDLLLSLSRLIRKPRQTPLPLK